MYHRGKVPIAALFENPKDDVPLHEFPQRFTGVLPLANRMTELLLSSTWEARSGAGFGASGAL